MSDLHLHPQAICRKCGLPISGEAFGSPEQGWEHLFSCPHGDVNPAVVAVLVDLAATEESFCPYYRKVGDKQCDRGCNDEPVCQTCHPPEGWPMERLPPLWRTAVEAEYDRRELEGWP